MSTSIKVGLGIVAAAFVLGVINGVLGVRLPSPVGEALLAVCAVTLGAIVYRELKRQPPKSG